MSYCKPLGVAKARESNGEYDSIYLGRNRGLYGEYCKVVQLLPNDRAEIQIDTGERFNVSQQEFRKRRPSD
jgi:hypothetical protein